MRYRYTGPDAARDLPIPGGVIRFDRMKWVDPVAAAEAMNVDPRHLDIVLANLNDEWQAEGPVKAARTRKRKAAEEQAAQDDDDKTDEAGDGPENPAVSGEEQA